MVIDDPSPATSPTSPDSESNPPVRDSPSLSVIVGRKQQRPHIGTVLQNYFQKKSDRQTIIKGPSHEILCANEGNSSNI